MSAALMRLVKAGTIATRRVTASMRWPLRLDVAFLDIDLCDAELTNGPGIDPETPGRLRRSERGRTVGKRKRLQQLTRKVLPALPGTFVTTFILCHGKCTSRA